MTNYLLRTKFILIIFIVYLGIAVFIVPYEGQNLAYSSFYHSTPNADLMKNLVENAQRIVDAKRTLNDLKHSGRLHQHLSKIRIKDTEFCFVIVSVSRPVHTLFLTQVVASLLSQITDADSMFTVYNAEGPSHHEAMNLSTIIPVVTKGESSAAVSKFAKEKQDYVRALEWCHMKRAKFSVILQDDALPPSDFVKRLKFILQYRVPQDSTKWAFLKLYYPEKWEGWGNEWRIVFELILTSMLGGITLTLLTYTFQVVTLRSLPNSSEVFSVCNFAMRFLLSFILTLYTLFTLGRPHWLALRSLSFHLSSIVPAPGCCIPAVVYPQTHLPGLIEHLVHAECSVKFPLDLAVDKFATDKGLEGLLVVPNLVKHIGFVSSLGKGWKNPREFRIF